MQHLLLPLLACGLFASSLAAAAPTRSRTAKPAAKSASKPASKSASKPAPKPAAKTSAKTAAKPTAKPVEDSPVLKHEKYPEFLDLLKQQVADNTPNYGPAFMCVLEATNGDETAIKDWMEAAARNGNAAAERWVYGQILADIPRDKLLSPEIKSAYQKLLKVADKGFVPAQLDICACLRMGIGVTKDENAAQKRMNETSKGGNFLARYQWLLSTRTLTSFDDKDKPEVAAEIERGNHYVIYRLATMAPNAATQLDWLKQAAQKGNNEAYFAMSSAVAAKQPKDSLVLLQEAVRLYHPMALFVYSTALTEQNAANPYVREAGIQADPARGLLMLKLSALLGEMQASLTLANAYYDGALGLPKDPKMAYFHFNNPAISSSAACAAARGLMMLEGNGVPQDTKKGLELIQRAADAGYAYSAILYAYAQYKGLGMPANAQDACETLREAAAMGAPVAYVYLAFIYAKGGEGLTADQSQAKRYIRLASIDLGDRAQQLFDALVLQGEWKAHP